MKTTGRVCSCVVYASRGKHFTDPKAKPVACARRMSGPHGAIALARIYKSHHKQESVGTICRGSR